MHQTLSRKERYRRASLQRGQYDKARNPFTGSSLPCLPHPVPEVLTVDARVH